MIQDGFQTQGMMTTMRRMRMRMTLTRIHLKKIQISFKQENVSKLGVFTDELNFWKDLSQEPLVLDSVCVADMGDGGVWRIKLIMQIVDDI